MRLCFLDHATQGNETAQQTRPRSEVRKNKSSLRTEMKSPSWQIKILSGTPISWWIGWTQFRVPDWSCFFTLGCTAQYLLSIDMAFARGPFTQGYWRSTLFRVGSCDLVIAIGDCLRRFSDSLTWSQTITIKILETFQNPSAVNSLKGICNNSPG